MKIKSYKDLSNDQKKELDEALEKATEAFAFYLNKHSLISAGKSLPVEAAKIMASTVFEAGCGKVEAMINKMLAKQHTEMRTQPQPLEYV